MCALHVERMSLILWIQAVCHEFCHAMFNIARCLRAGENRVSLAHEHGVMTMTISGISTRTARAWQQVL